jgi:hypothetical protein
MTMINLQNVPLESSKNVLVAKSVHSHSNIPSDEIQDLSVDQFARSRNGVTFNDLIARYNISKKRAQRKLKECCRQRLLFVPESEDHKPQRYYPTCLKADVIEYLNKKNVQVGSTVLNRTTRHPLYTAVEYQKARNLLDILLSIGQGPLYIHKLHLHLSIDKECYHQQT